MMKNHVTKLYSHIPSCPGVYFMKNEEDKIIYIGKSNNLKSRVRSYFVPGATLNFAKKKMVKIITKIDYIETKSDLEALMLETNLIKTHQPKYNVLMKDGKNLSYIKITDDEIPMIVRTRIKTNRGEYFGPYSQYFDTYRYLRFIRKLFKLGNHEKLEFRTKNQEGRKGGKKSSLGTLNFELGTGAKRNAPCMDTYIGLCPGHCTGDPVKIETYKERLMQARDFLLGKQEIVLEDLKNKMLTAAKERLFEEAKEYKDMIDQVESAGNRQIVRDVISGDALVAVKLEKYDCIYLSIIEVKSSMIVGVHEYNLANPLGDPADTIVEQAVIQYLSENMPKVFYTDIELSDEAVDWLKVENIKLKTPSRGEKVRILEFAHTNLLNFAYRQTMDGLKNATLSKKTMLDLLTKLEFFTKEMEKKKEIIFECFDISHSHGEHTVASKSVLVNGKPDNKRYKKYRIKTLKTGKIDDFASMEEILTRRALGAIRGEDPWPDLIIIDGGKGQLSHAVSAIKKVIDDSNTPPGQGGIKGGGVEHIENLELGTLNSELGTPHVISLAKRIEEVFIPGQSEPILFEKGSPELMLLQKIRDEAHRFAINYNRSSREKGYTKTILDEIPGIGPSTRKKILRTVSRVEELSSWTYDQARDAFGKKAAEALQDHGLIL